jgi:hypothetical protein
LSNGEFNGEAGGFAPLYRALKSLSVKVVLPLPISNELTVGIKSKSGILLAEILYLNAQFVKDEFC